MTGAILAILLAAIAGSCMAIQGTLNSTLSKTAGLLGATLAVHLIGLITIVPLFFFMKSSWPDLKHLLEAPKYSYFGGVLSVAIIYLVASSISKSGAVTATTAIIAAQIATAAIIDRLGLFGLEKCPITWPKALGLILLAIATWLTTRST